MSELEIKRRQEYKLKRKKRISYQLVAIILLAALTLFSFLTYNRMDETYYVEYTENGSVDYKVKYDTNDFFDSEWIEPDHAYISALISEISATFKYKLNIAETNVAFDYAYGANALLLITSNDTGNVYYSFEDTLVTMGEAVRKKGGIEINQYVPIDYDRYNAIATSFVKTYNLKSASCSLLVSLNVDAKVGNSNIEMPNGGDYSVTLNIPLNQDSFSLYTTQSSSPSETKMLAYKNAADRDTFLFLTLGLAVLLLATVAVFFGYVELTKNEDVTYEAKIKKLVRAYGSFIQRMYGEFDRTGYQIINIKTFTEMLGIRDTIQSPVLMSENKDETMTSFFVPTDTKLLYVFEIKVDNYDEIYGTNKDEKGVKSVEAPENEAVETPVETIEVKAETVVATAPVEISVNIPDAFEITESEDGEGEEILEYVDEKGNRIKIGCKRSFTANLIQSNPQIKDYYNALKNEILSYAKVKAKTSFRNETYKKGRIQLFKMKIRGKTICLYCALDPLSYSESKYSHTVATAKSFAEVPMMVKVRSDRGLKRAMTLISDVMARFSILKNEKYVEGDYVAEYPYESTKSLVERGLIKLLFPDATAAEPQAHHHVYKKREEETVSSLVEEEIFEKSEEEAKRKEIADALVEIAPEDGDAEGEGVLAYLDEGGNLIKIGCKRSFKANLIQSVAEVRDYYNRLKNLILSFKGVKSKISFRNETYKRGRVQLFKMKIRGKTICLYCALDPSEYSEARYFHKVAEAKAYADVPMMVKIKSERGLKRAMTLINDVMTKFFINANEKYVETDYLAEYPYETTKSLVERGLVKLLFPDATAAEPKEEIKK